MRRSEYGSEDLQALRGAVLEFLVSAEGEALEEGSAASEGLRAFVKVVPELVDLREMESEVERLGREFGQAAERLGEIGGGLREARAGVYGRVAGALWRVLQK